MIKKIDEAKLKIKPAKCKFTQISVKYIGHILRGGPAEAKFQAV